MSDISRKALKRGDIVQNLETGKFGVIGDIQTVHNRYQLSNVSGWQYGIDKIAKKSAEDIVSALESMPSTESEGEVKRLRKALIKAADISSSDGAGRDMTRINMIVHEALRTNEEPTATLSSHREDVEEKNCSTCEGTGKTIRYGKPEEGEPNIVKGACTRCNGTGIKDGRTNT